MDNRVEVREFLTSRRAKITPQQAGMPDVGVRRVPGLRRGEVAALAGVSVEYYSKLERGAIGGVSASVLDAIARALQLDDAERTHLFNLAHAADGTSAGMRPRRRPAKRWTARPSLTWVLDKITTPAIIRNGRMDLLAANDLGRAMHTAVYASAAGGQPNFARFTFLDVDAAHDFYPRWEIAADTCVAILRTEAGRDPHDKDLHDLVGELSTRSSDFRRRWGSHDVRLHGAGSKLFHHAVVGDLDLSYESVDMISDPGLTLTLYAAEPGSSTAHALDLLASWQATELAETAAAAETAIIARPRLHAPDQRWSGARLPPVEHHRIPVGRDLDFTPEEPQPSPQRRSRTNSPSPNTARRRHLSMTTLAIVGAGTGLGAAVARRFGAEGFDVAVISRRQDRVDALAADLAAAGFTARGYAASVRDPEALTGALEQAANDLGPIEVLQYSPVPQAEFMHAVLDTTVADLTGAVEFSIYGPLTAVRHVLPGMRTLGRGTVLFVNGGSGARPNPKVAGTSIAFAGEGAYAAMLHTAVAEENIHVGQLIIPGGITPGHHTHDPDVLADRLWTMHTSRDTFRVFAEPMNL